MGTVLAPGECATTGKSQDERVMDAPGVKYLASYLLVTFRNG